jgi:hypothetical protein
MTVYSCLHIISLSSAQRGDAALGLGVFLQSKNTPVQGAFSFNPLFGRGCCKTGVLQQQPLKKTRFVRL